MLGKEIEQAGVGHLHPPKPVHIQRLIVAGRKTQSERNSVGCESSSAPPDSTSCTSSQALGRDQCRMEGDGDGDGELGSSPSGLGYFLHVTAKGMDLNLQLVG